VLQVHFQEQGIAVDAFVSNNSQSPSSAIVLLRHLSRG
jgi:hypothetical protein